MGQTSSHRQMHHSSNNNNKEEPPQPASQFGNRRTSTRKSTSSSKHYPTLVQPLRKDELSLLRDSLLRNGKHHAQEPGTSSGNDQ
ncbi:GM21965 [Drosophila sechellia]|uniref:GM21965 n=1 Tax=Drosophila sechellia TaxID=7238 RepID=B4HPH1_DROSE|nr:GM21965 [Drosophila sechellia]